MIQDAKIVSVQAGETRLAHSRRVRARRRVVAADYTTHRRWRRFLVRRRRSHDGDDDDGGFAKPIQQSFLIAATQTNLRDYTMNKNKQNNNNKSNNKAAATNVLQHGNTLSGAPSAFLAEEIRHMRDDPLKDKEEVIEIEEDDGGRRRCRQMEPERKKKKRWTKCSTKVKDDWR